MILIVFTLSVTAVRRWQSGLQEAVVLNFNSFQPLMGKKIDLVDLAAKIGMEDIKSLIFFMIYKKLVTIDNFTDSFTFTIAPEKECLK